jgi:hypothetical protein
MLFRGNRKSLKYVRTITLILFIGVFAYAPFWYAGRMAQRKELQALYLSASGGDLESVKRLTRLHSSDATEWLETLAEDRNAFAESRAEAVTALGERHLSDSGVIARFLWIEQPFVVRHAAANVFKRHGCDGICISSVLYALHAISTGAPTAESRLLAQNPVLGVQVDSVVNKLTNQSEDDYVSLLNKDSCLTRRLLERAYASESAFVTRVTTKLGPCG